MTGAIELQLDDEPRSSLSIGPGFGRCSGISPKFARRFAKGIGKLAGNTPEDRRKKTGRLIARMPEATGLARVIWAVDPARAAGKSPIPWCSSG
ncbi:hypothetical protein B296_00018139 [Ensete ventricosum]|uniref:Uncharacterized protein n=1 Tax=Ensete ventricosum TaxID=4639 RepID=A0A427AFE5_ENSVE|nr:hypothetical protein B296_00018139 [Ensete ventricosum]